MHFKYGSGILEPVVIVSQRTEVSALRVCFSETAGDRSFASREELSSAFVAQLDRASDFESAGHTFESCRGRILGLNI